MTRTDDAAGAIDTGTLKALMLTRDALYSATVTQIEGILLRGVAAHVVESHVDGMDREDAMAIAEMIHALRVAEHQVGRGPECARQAAWLPEWIDRFPVQQLVTAATWNAIGVPGARA